MPQRRVPASPSPSGVLHAPMVTSVPGCATIAPMFFRPMNRMNRPMPPAVATCSDSGMPAAMVRRMPISPRIRNSTPEVNTAPSATVQGTWLAMHSE